MPPNTLELVRRTARRPSKALEQVRQAGSRETVQCKAKVQVGSRKAAQHAGADEMMSLDKARNDDKVRNQYEAKRPQVLQVT